MRFFLAFIALGLHLVSAKCTIGQGNVEPCGKHTAIIVDSTKYQADEKTATKVFEFVSTYLSTLDLSSGNYSITMGYYGLGDPSVSWSPIMLDFAKSSPKVLCENYEGLLTYEKANHYGICLIETALLGLYNITGVYESHYDDILWITATHDQVDVDESAKFLSAFGGTRFTVVNMGTADFSSWKGTRVICQQYPFPADFSATVFSQVCRNNQTADQGCKNLPATSTQPRPMTTTTPVFSDNLTCPCEPKKVWTDVYVLFDGVLFTAAKFKQVVSIIKDSLFQLSIGQGQQDTRIGISVYGDTVHHLASLDRYTNSDGFMTQQIQPLPSDYGTNIDAAISDARAHFNSSEHRPYARKVIIVVGAGYRDGNYSSPSYSALVFQNYEGGIIISLDFGYNNGSTNVLKSIASRGYWIDGLNLYQDEDEKAIVHLMCEANCLCPKGYRSAQDTPRYTPAEGCFKVSNAATDAPTASGVCGNDGGVLGATKDTYQRVFAVGAQSNQDSPLWVGLSKNNASNWVWSDGTPMNGSSSIVAGSGSCAYLIKREK
ncbi:unnamed protein product, partial [Mesorhabditis spiculigera]